MWEDRREEEEETEEKEEEEGVDRALETKTPHVNVGKYPQSIQQLR